MQNNKKLYNISEIWFTILIFSGMMGKYFKSNILFQGTSLILATIMVSFTSIIFIYESKKVKLNKIVLVYIIVTVCSMVLNVKDLKNYLLYIATIMAYYMFSKILKENYLKIVTYVFFILNIVNIIFITISPKFLSYKNISGMVLTKHIFINSNIMEFSTTAILSLYLVFLALNIKNNRKLKIFILIVNILLILYLGKLSVILTGVASILIVSLIRFISKAFPNKKIYVILSIIMVATVALTGILLPHIIKNPNLIKLFSGRLELWGRFTSYFSEGGLKALFGYGFVNPDLKIGEFYHPHNQYITVLYTTGLFGYLAYISILIYTLTINIIFSIKYNIYSNLYILISILILQVADDYFVLTSFPLTICIIIYYLNNNIEQNNRKMVTI